MRGIGSSELRVTSHPQGSPKTGHPELIEQGLGHGRNAMAIWQDLFSDHGFPHGYQTVKCLR